VRKQKQNKNISATYIQYYAATTSISILHALAEQVVTTLLSLEKRSVEGFEFKVLLGFFNFYKQYTYKEE